MVGVILSLLAPVAVLACAVGYLADMPTLLKGGAATLAVWVIFQFVGPILLGVFGPRPQ